jgi:hypothetical protein
MKKELTTVDEINKIMDEAFVKIANNITGQLPDVYFGSVMKASADWRSKLPVDEPDDDELLAETPADVIGMLGFDPLTVMDKIDAATERVLKIGGPGSGNFEHEGRPGLVGGSAPQGGSSPMQENVTRAVKESLATTEKHEPKVTALLEGLAAKHGGTMVGLKFRMKTESSLIRKVMLDSNKKDIPPEEALALINDKLRYTMTFHPDNLVANTKAVEDELRKNGYNILDHKSKNFYGPNHEYEGYNTVWTDGKDEVFEVQFHTPDSHRIKEENHEQSYVKSREVEDEAELKKLSEQMVANWTINASKGNYIRPKDFHLLGIQQAG